MSASKPGDILVYDYRITTKTNVKTQENNDFKVLQWNIERGYKCLEIIKEIKALDPDIVFLQEVDIGNARSQNEDHMLKICSSCNLLGGFVTEFEELESPLRSDRDQGGGVHGNAILSKFETKFYPLHHAHQPVDWEREGTSLKEPRRGRRFTLVAEVETPNQTVLCYSAHLEVFCGITGRVAQFSEILSHSYKNIQKFPFQLVFGDLNTMGHTITRLSPKYCRDEFRWRSIGYFEAEWWWKYVLSWHVEDGPINRTLASILPANLQNSDILKAARNPGLFDPWNPVEDITLHNPNYFGLYKAKLDWTLLRGFRVSNKFIGNKDFSASDHSYLFLSLDSETDMSLFESSNSFHSRVPKQTSEKTAIFARNTSFYIFAITCLYYCINKIC